MNAVDWGAAMSPSISCFLAAAGLAAVALAAGGCSPAAEISAPILALDDIDVRGFSGGVADLSLDLDVINQNNFEIVLVQLSGALDLDAQAVGTVNWSGEFACAKRDTTTVRIPVRLTVEEEAAGIFRSLIDRRPMPAGLRGETTIARGVIRRTYPVALTRALAGQGG